MVFFVGLCILSLAVGNLSAPSYGFAVLGVGLIAAGIHDA